MIGILLPEDVRYYTERINLADYKKSYEHYCLELEALFSEGVSLPPAGKAAEELLALCGERMKKRLLKKLMRFDLSQFFIFYTLPAVLGQKIEYWERFSEAFCALWNEAYSDSRISPCRYEELLEGFGNTIFGWKIK